MAGFMSRKAFLLWLFYAVAMLSSHENALDLAYAASTNKPQPLASLCSLTTNASFCLATLSMYPSLQTSVLLQDLTAFVVLQALAKVNQTYWMGKKMAALEEAADGRFTLQDCLEMLDNSVDGLNRSVDRLSHLDASILSASLQEQVMDVRVWLSSSLTYLDTCWDELGDPKAVFLKARFSSINHDIEPLLAIALSLAQTLQKEGGASISYAIPGHQRRSSSSHP